MAETVTFQDVIKYNPPNYVYLSQTKWSRIYYNKNYHPIVKILTNSKKTAEEIYELYPKYEEETQLADIKKRAIKGVSAQITKEHKKEKKKSDTTIYRYIKELIKEGIIAEYGRRLRSDNVASKKIYGLAAKLFLPANEYIGVWKSDGATEVAKRAGNLIKHNFGDKSPNAKKFSALLTNFESKNEELERSFLDILFEKINLMNSFDDQNRKLFSDGYENIFNFSREEIFVFFNLIRWIFWYLEGNNYNSFIKNLKDIVGEQQIDTEEKSSSDEENISRTRGSETDMISYKQPNVYFGNWDQLELSHNSLDHAAIMDLLKENVPMTVKEIHSKHSDAIKKRINRVQAKCRRIGEECPTEYQKEPQEKVENTIYRYVKDLMDGNLVVEAGRRIDPDSPTTSILYSAIAKQFIFFEDTDEYWNYDNWDKVILTLSVSLALFLGKSNINISKFHDIITEIEKNKFNSFSDSLQKTESNNIIGQFLKGLHYTELNACLKIIGLVEWLLNTENLNEIKVGILSCFN
jgi:predicted transcriptional regulator